MARAASQSAVSVEAYLAGEELSEVRHEFVDGRVHAMVGASKAHNLITQRLARLLSDGLAGSPCEVYALDVKVHVRAEDMERFYYPDLLVECEPFTADPYLSERPVLIVEVLSERTERVDRAEKFHAYRNLPSLAESVLVAQDEPRVEVYRRATGWALEVCGAGQTLRLDSVGMELALARLYPSPS
jgi:Uma2 family endonuclease